MGCLRLGFACVCVLAGFAAGCGETEEPGDMSRAATYIGVVEGTETRIAVVQTGRGLLAYVCGRGATLESHTRWFEGALDEHDAGAFQLESDDWQLRVSARATAMSGELRAPNGETLVWTAVRAPQDAASEVGLYESYELGCRSGVIVWRAEGGPNCRAQGVWCDESGERGQVTPADCTADAPLVVRGVRDGTAFDFVVERVQSP